MYTEESVETFLKNQGQLFDEAVASSYEEAEEFLEDCMAVELKTLKEVRAYFDEAGADISGMTDEELEDATITMPEMARLLGITRSQVYGILKNSKYSHFFETIVIAEKKRITKESFQKFLDGQDYYKLDSANDYEELSMEQNFSLANYRRKKLAKTGDRSKNGNLGYLTFDEAAFLAKVSRGMIYKWIDDGKFSSVKIGYISRVKRDEFEVWLKERERKGN